MAYSQLVDTTPYQQLSETVEAPKSVEASVSVSEPVPRRESGCEVDAPPRAGPAVPPGGALAPANGVNPFELVATQVSRPSSGRALDPLPGSDFVMTVAAPGKAA